MNRHPSAARALAAMLLLTALWPLGCSAGDVRQTSAAPPASAGQPLVPAAAGLPASLQGQWIPTGKSLETTGPLILGARTLRWSICGKAQRRIQPQVADGGPQTDFPAFNAYDDPPQVINRGPQALIVLTPPCKLDGQLITHLRLKPSTRRSPISSSACQLEATFYRNRPPPAGPEQVAWGTFTDKRWFANQRCPAVQAP